MIDVSIWWLVALHFYAGGILASKTVEAASKSDASISASIGLKTFIWVFIFCFWPLLPALDRIFGE